jgi:hypothetical protein
VSEWRRQAIVILDEDVIRSVLQLPDDLRIISVRGYWKRGVVGVMVEGERLAPVAPGCEPPSISGSWEYDEEGQRVRFVPIDWDLAGPG